MKKMPVKLKDKLKKSPSEMKAVTTSQSVIPVERPSREALKRKMNQLQGIGKTMLELPQGKFSKLDLPEELHSALVEARRLTAHGAKRRQLQFVGRIMDQFDAVDLLRQLRDIDHKKASGNGPKQSTH